MTCFSKICINVSVIETSTHKQLLNILLNIRITFSKFPKHSQNESQNQCEFSEIFTQYKKHEINQSMSST